MKTQSGFSLTELLISLLLVSILTASVLQWYFVNKQLVRMTAKALENRFEIQFVNDLLAESIRSAGFTPCLAVDQLHVVDSRNNAQSVAGVVIDAPANSLMVHRMSPYFSTVLAIESPYKIVVSKAVVPNLKRALFIADCYHAEIHQIQQVVKRSGGYVITLAKPLVFPFAEKAYAGEWVEEKWFIHTNPQGHSALYYQSIQKEELTPLIHAMSIKQTVVQNKRLLAVTFGLDAGKTHTLVVAVRNT